MIETITTGNDYVCAGRFTAADISVGYALLLANRLGLASQFGPSVTAYWARLQQREGYLRAVESENSRRRRAGFGAPLLSGYTDRIILQNERADRWPMIA